MAMRDISKIKARRVIDGEDGPCAICGKKGLYVIGKGQYYYRGFADTGNVAGICRRDACLNICLLSDKFDWIFTG